MPAMPAKPADADALPSAPADHVGADGIDSARDRVPGDAREGELGPLPSDGETIAVAHPAGFDADADLAPRRLGYFAFDRFERAAGPRHLYRPHLCHYPLRIGRSKRHEWWPTESWEGIDPHR